MDKKIAFTLILVAAIVGAGIMAYNADELYLTGRDNVVVAMPARLVGGHEASIITTATDLDGEPAADREILVELKTHNKTFELTGERRIPKESSNPPLPCRNTRGMQNLWCPWAGRS